jgi:hypothetical protein
MILTRNTTFALAAGIAFIFAAGVYLGMHLAGIGTPASVNSRQQLTGNARSSLIHNEGVNPVSSQAPSTGKKVLYDPQQEAVLAKIRKTRMLPESSRIRSLLQALEETSKLTLNKELLDELRSIVSEGERESSHFILSLMEQREDKVSVAFLLETAGHPNADVADRALFALEAVAGNVFHDRADAAAWASTWQPSADRAKLFAPNQAQENNDFAADLPREIRPVRNEESSKLPDK